MIDESDDIRLRYSWDWFSYHAGQRFASFNFFLILMGAIIVGYTQAVDNDLPDFGIVLGVLGLVVSGAFWAMEVRNDELVLYGRAELINLEKKLDIRILRADKERRLFEDAMGGAIERHLFSWIKPCWIKHRVGLRLVIGVLGGASFAGAVWAASGFPGASAKHQALVCVSTKTSPCSALRSSSYGTMTRR